MSSAEAIRRFCNGEAAMLFSGNFNYSTLLNALGENLGAFPLPANDQDQPLCTVVSKGGGTAIYSGSQHIELCKKSSKSFMNLQMTRFPVKMKSGRFSMT